MFDTSLLAAVWAGASGRVGRDEVLAARERGAVAGLAAATAGTEPTTISWFGERLLAATADLDGMGRPLFAALRALDLPDDAHGRAWRAAELVREHRGDGHLAACVAAGLTTAEANVLTELWLGYPIGGYSSSRGLGADGQQRAVDALRARGWIDDAGDLTAVGREARDEVEAATDRSQDALITALGDDVEAVIAAGVELSERILAARATPADPRKRAAG